MASVITDVARMEASAAHVEQVNAELAAVINTVRGRVDASRAAWQGGAQVAFAALMSNYDDASRRLQASLDSIAARIRQNGRGYDASESENRASFGAVGSSLNI